VNFNKRRDPKARLMSRRNFLKGKETMTYITQLTSRKTMSILQIMTMILAAFVLVVLQSSTVHAQWATSGNNINNTNTGNVGIGTTNPGRPLVVTADASGVPLRVYRNASNVGWGTGIDWAFNNSAGNVTDYAYVNSTVVTNTAGSENGTLGFFTIKSGTLTQQAIIDQNGNVGIGTTGPTAKLDVAGGINASGTITGGNIVAKYQDFAEWVQSSQRLAAGTVVVLDHTRSNQVIASSQAYDTRVAGVISSQPGITLGENGAGKVLVATTGRVKIKVDASRGAIRVGDLLVTSNVAGVAMKSQPLNLGGVQIHRPGTLIGKALEPLAKGIGEILVLLSLQ
jgi:hypothetical protein